MQVHVTFARGTEHSLTKSSEGKKNGRNFKAQPAAHRTENNLAENCQLQPGILLRGLNSGSEDEGCLLFPCSSPFPVKQSTFTI